MGIIYKNGIAYGNQPSIDATLTHQGEAADAKAVGDAVGELRNTLNHKADIIYDTASGDIASFPDGADGLPVKDLTVAIEPVQSGTGDPSPTNVRPISGWTVANITRTGVNVWDEEWEQGHYDGSTGQKSESNQKVRSKNLIPVLPNTQYYAVVPTPPTQLNAYWYDAERTFISADTRLGIGGIFTTPDNCYFMAFSSFGKDYNTYNHDISINYPSIDHDYHPGIGNTTIPISWQSSAGTVYGGTLDVTTGVLTVTHGIFTENGTANWSRNPSGSFYLTGQSTNVAASSDGLCNYSPYVYSNSAMYSIYARPNGQIAISYGWSDTWPDIETLKAAFAQTPLQVVWPFANPQTYQLTPTEVITTILGQNNIWADCGPSTVEYPADTKLYIQKINTPTDDDMIADANIASGKYFIVNNNLYLSTAAILAGDPIKPGTNCTLTNLAAALNALNS